MTARARRHPAAGDWWTLWWRHQKRRHRIHLSAAFVVGVTIGRWTR